MLLGKSSPNLSSTLPPVQTPVEQPVAPVAWLEAGQGTQGGWTRPLYASRAEEICMGRLESDAEQLEQRVAELRAQALAKPQACLVGTVDYEGRFEFAYYPEAGDQPASLELSPVPTPWGVFQPEIDAATFCQWVTQAQELIAAGDIYQVNLTRRFRCDAPGDPLSFYEALKKVSPAPYAAFLRQSGRTIISSSPECFLKIDGRTVITRPIKGTRPRARQQAMDEAHREALGDSEKERAELLMITDLMRNDLGKVCDYGTVEVAKLAGIESFAQVHHLVSTVEGTLKPGVGHVAALKACFPGGSITGAPKKRAMEIIQAIEPAPRGLYTGALGIFRADGTSEFSIAIRTVIIEDGQAHFHVGAGIVADSVAGAEFIETEEKAKGILLAAKQLQKTENPGKPVF